MRVIGIIAEYNPFHNGHEYLISEARRLVGDPRAIVLSVMSGPYVQRGTPSVLPKHIRTRQALFGGCNVVVELPFTFACAPSERFAKGAVELLYRTGVITDIAFGIDTDHTDILNDLVDIEPDEKVLRAGLKEGKSYPAARADAIIKSLDTDLCNNVTAISEVLRMPNSILALDYLKAIREINAGFRVHMIRRAPGASATSTREAIWSSGGTISGLAESLSDHMPNRALAIVLAEIAKKSFSLPDRDKYAKDMINMIRTRNDIQTAAYMTDGLDGYLKNVLHGGGIDSYQSFIEAVATKHFTNPRIMRALASLICGQSAEYIEREKHLQYIRVLGFDREGRYCLKIMGKCARLPILSNCSDAAELYSSNKRLEEQFRLDLNSNSVQAGLLEMPPDYEWSLPPVMIK